MQKRKFLQLPEIEPRRCQRCTPPCRPCDQIRHVRLEFIYDRVEPVASPAMSAMPPKAEVNSEHSR